MKKKGGERSPKKKPLSGAYGRGKEKGGFASGWLMVSGPRKALKKKKKGTGEKRRKGRKVVSRQMWGYSKKPNQRKGVKTQVNFLRERKREGGKEQTSRFIH